MVLFAYHDGALVDISYSNIEPGTDEYAAEAFERQQDGGARVTFASPDQPRYYRHKRACDACGTTMWVWRGVRDCSACHVEVKGQRCNH